MPSSRTLRWSDWLVLRLSPSLVRLVAFLLCAGFSAAAARRSGGGLRASQPATQPPEEAQASGEADRRGATRGVEKSGLAFAVACPGPALALPLVVLLPADRASDDAARCSLTLGG